MYIYNFRITINRHGTRMGSRNLRVRPKRALVFDHVHIPLCDVIQSGDATGIENGSYNICGVFHFGLHCCYDFDRNHDSNSRMAKCYRERQNYLKRKRHFALANRIREYHLIIRKNGSFRL